MHREATGPVWAEDNLIDTELMPSDNLKYYDNFPSVINDLQNKRIDVAIYDVPSLRDAIAGKPMEIRDQIETGEVYGIAIRKEDPKLTREVLEVMKKLALEGMTMLVVTHEMGFARSVAIGIIFMENKTVLEAGNTRTFKRIYLSDKILLTCVYDYINRAYRSGKTYIFKIL